jgi:hypothetical protein
MDKLKSLNMCDFCARERETCGAQTIPAKELSPGESVLSDPAAIVACDIYENPVDILKKKFH